MAFESPLFQSAMELLGHSYSHFNGDKEIDRKLVILHLANAVELILKDLVLDLGESIYKGPKETITIHGCIKTIVEKGEEIPFLNKIELLIDERNALQHRFGSPNELTAIFYMNIAQDFFKEVLSRHYDQDLEEVMSQFADPTDFDLMIMGKTTSDNELDQLKKLSKVHPLGALLSVMTYFERKIISFYEVVGVDEDYRRRPAWAIISHRSLERFSLSIPHDLRKKLDETRRLRNLAAHGRREPSKQDVLKAINAISEFESYLDGLDIDVVKSNIEAYKAERERERMSAIRVPSPVEFATPATTDEPRSQ